MGRGLKDCFKDCSDVLRLQGPLWGCSSHFSTVFQWKHYTRSAFVSHVTSFTMLTEPYSFSFEVNSFSAKQVYPLRRSFWYQACFDPLMTCFLGHANQLGRWLTTWSQEWSQVSGSWEPLRGPLHSSGRIVQSVLLATSMMPSTFLSQCPVMSLLLLCCPKCQHCGRHGARGRHSHPRSAKVLW